MLLRPDSDVTGSDSEGADQSFAAAGRSLSLSAAICAAIVVLTVRSTAVAQTLEQVQAINTYVDQNGLDSFREAIAANGWQAPVMPSKWHLENKAAPAVVPIGQAARDLGLTLVQKTDAWTDLMLTENGQDLLNRATCLVDLAQWVGAAEGYGNFFVAGHACDVALTGLARLVADIDFPLADVKAEVESCNLPIISPAAGARILNQEVGDQVFPANAATLDEIARPYGARQGWSLARDTPPQERAGFYQLARQAVVDLGLDPDAPDPHEAFFQDERCERPATTDLCWDKKRHHSIVVGSRILARLSRLPYLITFRETVGEYPTVPASPGGVFSNVQVAFDEAWRPHYSDGTQNLGIVAGGIYEQILAGNFIDFDTADRRVANHFATPGALPAPTNGTPVP